MSVATAYAPSKQAGNGSTVAFSGSWKIQASSDLEVRKIAADGSIGAILTLNSDYTVSFDTVAETWTVTYTVAPVSSGYALITRSSAKTQATVWPRDGNTPAKSIENAVDKLTLLAQERFTDELSGLSAARPSAPTIKTWYYATDTAKYSVYLPAPAAWIALN